MALPGPGSAKNFGLSPAAHDLGLGDQLVQQLQDQEEERKKKLLQLGQVPNANGLNGISPGAMQLIGGMGGGLKGG